MSVNTKMTAIADEIRTLSNTADPMGLDAMATNVGAANAAVNTQEDLIAQIQSALEGKAGGGGGSSEPIETATITNYSNTDIYCADLNDNIVRVGQNQSVICKIPTLAYGDTIGTLNSYVYINGKHIMYGRCGIWVTGNIAITEVGGI